MDDILHQAEQIAAAADRPFQLWLLGAVAFRWTGPGTCVVTNPRLSWAIAPTRAKARAYLDALCQEEYPAAEGWQVYLTCEPMPMTDVEQIVNRIRRTP